MTEEKKEGTSKSRWALPHVFVLLFGIIVFATVMTWILPANLRALPTRRARKSSRPGRIIWWTPIPSGSLRCSNASTSA